MTESEILFYAGGNEPKIEFKAILIQRNMKKSRLIATWLKNNS